MRARIHLVLAAHLCMSPRGQREAAVLQEAGYEVTLSGVWFDPLRAELDRELMRRHNHRFRPALDFRPGNSPMSNWRERAKGRWARSRFAWTRTFSPTLLGYGVAEQLTAARRIDADLTIVHGEAGLWIARELWRDDRRVGIDFEDWFSRDLPVTGQAGRPIDELASLEHWALKHARYRVASSRALATALAEAYRVDAPAVVTNAGQEPADHVPRPPGRPLRLHWFSQTIGPARGLELLFTALPLVRNDVRIELLGACGSRHRAWLERMIPPAFRSQVTLRGPVPPWELPGRLAEHDVGLTLETRQIASRNVCIPNKFFHVLASGLAVIATSTEGHRESLAPCPEAGLLVDEASPAALAAAIDRLAENPEFLAATQRAARTAAQGPWSGEAEREIIRVEAARALASSVASPAAANSPAAQAN